MLLVFTHWQWEKCAFCIGRALSYFSVMINQCEENLNKFFPSAAVLPQVRALGMKWTKTDKIDKNEWQLIGIGRTIYTIANTTQMDSSSTKPFCNRNIANAKCHKPKNPIGSKRAPPYIFIWEMVTKSGPRRDIFKIIVFCQLYMCSNRMDIHLSYFIEFVHKAYDLFICHIWS